MLKDGDILYYKCSNGITIIIGYDSKFDGKNISLDSLNKTMIDKVVRDGEVVWKKEILITPLLDKKIKKFNKNLYN